MNHFSYFNHFTWSYFHHNFVKWIQFCLKLIRFAFLNFMANMLEIFVWESSLWLYLVIRQIEAWTKWLPFCRCHFQIYLLRENVYFVANFSPLCGSSWEWFSINPSPPSAAYMRQWIRPTLVQLMACCLFSTKPWPEPMPLIVSWTKEQNFSEILIEIFHSRKCIWKCCLQNDGHFFREGDELIQAMIFFFELVTSHFLIWWWPNSLKAYILYMRRQFSVRTHMPVGKFSRSPKIPYTCIWLFQLYLKKKHIWLSFYFLLRS